MFSLVLSPPGWAIVLLLDLVEKGFRLQNLDAGKFTAQHDLC